MATRVGFADVRRFGFMGLIPTDQVETHPWFAGMGPEPLGNGFSGAWLAEIFDGKKQNIKVSLLDQRNVAGLGNIYVCEALVPGADLAPDRGGQGHPPPGRDAGLGDPRRAQRRHRGRRLHAEGLRQRRGRAGLFPAPVRRLWPRGQTLSQFERGRKVAPGVVKRIVQAGRSTFYCPSCQKK
jgi:formamidopyrimidine-DNA glycosylase